MTSFLTAPAPAHLASANPTTQIRHKLKKPTPTSYCLGSYERTEPAKLNMEPSTRWSFTVAFVPLIKYCKLYLNVPDRRRLCGAAPWISDSHGMTLF